MNTKVTKKDLRIIGSAGSMSDLLDLIRDRMYWKVEETRPSEQYTIGRKQVFDLRSASGWRSGLCIVKDGGRYKLYFVAI